MSPDLDTLPRDVMRALGFLTRLPVPAKWFEGDDGKLVVTARAFPDCGSARRPARCCRADCPERCLTCHCF